MKWKLYLDDIRTPADSAFMIARTVNDAQKLIHLLGVPTFISFDHDLGIDDEDNLLLSGYDFAKWLVEMDMEGKLAFPENFGFKVHSQNPVGAKNIQEYLNQYLSIKDYNSWARKKDLNPKTHERLKEINAELKDLEEKFNPVAVRLDTGLQDELHRNVDGMDCYDLNLEIQCYNADEDAEPLCVLSEGLVGISTPWDREFFIGDGINHNVRNPENNPMKGEHHCWLYHCLYDHTPLSWEEIATIQTFWIEIKILRQYA